MCEGEFGRNVRAVKERLMESRGNVMRSFDVPG